MAEAPGHLLGQIIGNALEGSVEPLLREIAQRHNLYLDKNGPRAVRSGHKVTWADDLGNKHNLDFVLERGGSEKKVGNPAAFIESAWRRYTKHSRAKAQEIQGALLPLLSKHSSVSPFAGAVVAGRWTKGALQQMRSSGFSVLHVAYEDVVKAFREYGIDVDAEEATSDDYLRSQVEKYRGLSEEHRAAIAKLLCSTASDDYREFATTLEKSLARRVTRVLVLALHGIQQEFISLVDAIIAIQNYDVSSLDNSNFVRFEIQLMYSNGDTVFATFERGSDAIEFMQSFLS